MSRSALVLSSSVVALALLLAVSQAAAEPPTDRFPEKRHSWLRAMAVAPDALYVAGGRYVHRSVRGATDHELAGSLASTVADVAVSAGGTVVGAAGADGELGRLFEGRWEQTTAPPPPRARYPADHEAVAVADDGTVFAVTKKHGLHVWRGGDDLRTLPWPDGVDRAAAIAVIDGRPVVAGKRLCIRWDGRSWADVAGVSGDLRDLWFDPRTRTLYALSASGNLMAVDTTRWRVTETWKLPLFGPRSLHGSHDPQSGQLILGIGAQSKVALWSGGVVRELPDDLSFVEAAWFDPQTELVYTANREGLIGRWVGDAFDRDRATGTRTGLAGMPTDAPEDTSGPALSWRLGLDVIQGPMWKVHPKAQSAAYNLTLQLRSNWMWQEDGSGLGVVGTLAYSFEDTRVAGHLVELGVGASYRYGAWFGVTWLPRAVLGSPDGRFGVGVRHGVILDTLLGLVSVELGHQALWIDGSPRHDVRMVFGVDLFMVYQMAMMHHFLFSWL